MRILCVGDIHIKPNNTHLVELLEKQIINFIEEHQIEQVVLLGDILDTFERIHTQALNRAYEFINSIRVKVELYILVGNHDLINNQQFLTTNHWMNALKDWKNVNIVDKVIYNNGNLFVPYVPIKRFTEALNTFGEDWKNVNYIFAHQEFKGCKMGAVISLEGDEWQLDWPTVISGHIHDKQKPQDNIYYIGASIQNSFGDQSQNQLLLINTETKFLSELLVDLPKKKTVYLSLEETQTLQVDTLIKENTDMVRIVVKCDYDEFKVFTKTKEYEEIAKNQKCKIVHKISDENKIIDEPIMENSDSRELLYNKVLNTKNEYIYAIYLDIVNNSTINPKDILII